MAEAEVITLFNIFPELPLAIQRAVYRAVRKAAFDIQAQAGRMAPVDTGFLKNSIYVVATQPDGLTSSNYEARMAKAEARRDVIGRHSHRQSAQHAELLEMVDEPPDHSTAYVAVGAAYGLYVEFGTASVQAHPYLTPAAELVRPEFIAALSELESVLPLNGMFGSFSGTVEEGDTIG